MTRIAIEYPQRQYRLVVDYWRCNIKSPASVDCRTTWAIGSESCSPDAVSEAADDLISAYRDAIDTLLTRRRSASRDNAIREAVGEIVFVSYIKGVVDSEH
jgi:hypothetical protein